MLSLSAYIRIAALFVFLFLGSTAKGEQEQEAGEPIRFEVAPGMKYHVVGANADGSVPALTEAAPALAETYADTEDIGYFDGVIMVNTSDVERPNQGGIPFPNATVESILEYFETIRNTVETGQRRDLKSKSIVECDLRNLDSDDEDSDDEDSDDEDSDDEDSDDEDSDDEDAKASTGIQTVYLEFPNNPQFVATLFAPGLFNSYIFTDADQEYLLQRLQNDFSLYNIQFTLKKPQSCDFSTLTFGAPQVGGRSLMTITREGVLFGRAEQIDFGNRHHNDNAWVDSNFWTWILQFPFFWDKEKTFIDNSGQDDTTIPIQERLKAATLNQAANIGAHELGHLLGLRHYNSFGLQQSEDAFKFRILDNGGRIDLFPNDQSKTGTFRHVMASGQSAALPRAAEASADRYISERSAIKLYMGFNAKTKKLIFDEKTAKKRGGGIGANKKGQKLKNINVPMGTTGKKMKSAVNIVQGRLDDINDVDQYRYRFNAGQVLNFEVIGFVRPGPLEEICVTSLTLYREDDDGNVKVLAKSLQDYEGYDPVVFDFVIKEKGNYVVEITSQKFICLDQGAVCVDLVGYDEIFNYGNYDLFIYSVDKIIGKPEEKSDFKSNPFEIPTNEEDLAEVDATECKDANGQSIIC